MVGLWLLLSLTGLLVGLAIAVALEDAVLAGFGRLWRAQCRCPVAGGGAAFGEL